MKLFVFGSSLTSSYWNGAATYYRGIYKNLHSLGYQITFAEPDIYGRQQKRDAGEIDYATVRVYQTPRDLERMLAEAGEADLIIKHSGVGADDERLEVDVLRCRAGHTRTAFWDVDAPATLARVEENPWDPFRELIPQYDFIFTYGGGLPVMEHYLGGEGWGSRPLPANVCWIGHVGSCDHNRINCSARMVLNINRQSMARVGFSPPTRVFEAAGAGACVITDAWAGIDQFFEPGREILVAESAEDIVSFLRETPRQAACEIGKAMRERALRDHTYSLRAHQVHEALHAEKELIASPTGNSIPAINSFA